MELFSIRIQRTFQLVSTLDGKYAYGVSLFERAFLGGTRLGDGKGDTAVFRAWLLLFLPAGGYGQQDKEAADYRCY